MRRRMKILISVLFVAAIVILIGTLYEFVTEPKAWAEHPGWYAYYGGTTYPELSHDGLYNFTEYGNALSVGWAVWPAFNVAVVGLNGTFAGGFDFLDLQMWTNSQTFSFPFNGVTFSVHSITMSVNGTLYKNIPNINNNNVLLSSNWIASSQPGSSYFVVDYVYGISGHPYLYDYLNAGNYTITVSVTFTPVFESGPYYFSGGDQTFTWSYTQEFINETQP